jgi:hypothetical protein
MTVALDLRLCPRFAVWGWSVWIEWWDRGCVVGGRAELVNISLGGALILAPMRPSVGSRVTLCVEDAEPRIRILGVIVDAQTGAQGHRVNIEFVRPCPIALLRALIGDQLWVPEQAVERFPC